MTSSHPSLDEQGGVFVVSAPLFFLSYWLFFEIFEKKASYFFFVRCIIFKCNRFDLSTLLYIVALYIVAFSLYIVAI